jgi:outer membrane protein OmpA-like peptidoglycan-associated protein
MDAVMELDWTVAYLYQFPKINNDLSAHTDSHGNDDYNQQFSENGAISSVNT